MESNGNSTSVRRPGGGPMVIESDGSTTIHTEPGGASATVTDHGAKSDARLALIFAISSTVVSLMLMLFCYGLWNRYDLLKINYNDLKAAMLLHGVNPHPHFPGESP